MDEDSEKRPRPALSTEEGSDPVAVLRRAVAGPLASWREVYERFSPLDLTTGERHSRVPEPAEDCRRAAVLVPVLPPPKGAPLGEACLVYTVRTGNLKDHAGQVSFPGGAFEGGDASLLETALREAEEEVDLRPDLVEVVGSLEELYIPPSRFLVKPFVGLLEDGARMDLAPEEVEEVVSVPLAELVAPASLQRVVWEREPGRPHEVPVFAVRGCEIWGATAAITGALLARLGWSLEEAAGEKGEPSP